MQMGFEGSESDWTQDDMGNASLSNVPDDYAMLCSKILGDCFSDFCNKFAS